MTEPQAQPTAQVGVDPAKERDTGVYLILQRNDAGAYVLVAECENKKAALAALHLQLEHHESECLVYRGAKREEVRKQTRISF